MGCCPSSLAGDQTSPYPNNTTLPDTPSPELAIRPHPHASSRNITVASLPRPASPSRLGSGHGEHNVRPQPSVATIAPNKPLKPLNPAQRCPLPNSESTSRRDRNRHQRHRPIALSQPLDAPWTRKRLDFERTAFWDTRTNSRPEFWQAARMAVELLQQGEVQEAQGIIDAVGITCPRGEVWSGLFDEKGELLGIPEWVVLEPEGLVNEPEEEKSESEEVGSGADGEDVEKLRLTGETAAKGKGKALVSAMETTVNTGPMVKVRCRLSSTGKDYIVRMGHEEKVHMLATRLKDYAGLPYDQKIRFIYLGRTINEHHKLSETDWREGTIISVFVFDVPQKQQLPI